MSSIPELLTPQNLEYIERAREVAETVMRPLAAKYDREQEYPWEVQEAIKKAEKDLADAKDIQARTAAIQARIKASNDRMRVSLLRREIERDVRRHVQRLALIVERRHLQHVLQRRRQGGGQRAEPRQQRLGQRLDVAHGDRAEEIEFKQFIVGQGLEPALQRPLTQALAMAAVRRRGVRGRLRPEVGRNAYICDARGVHPCQCSSIVHGWQAE